MIAGMDRLRRAGFHLGAGGEAEAERRALARAAAEFWGACFEYDRWPPLLQARAAAVQARLFAKGPIREAIAGMDDRELRGLRGALTEFVAFAERLAGQPAEPTMAGR